MREPAAGSESQASSPARCAGPWAHLGALLELSKAKLCALVVVTAAAGFVLGSPGSVDYSLFGLAMVGIGLAGLGANALNQWMEIARDARMERTAGRPLPTGRLSRREALVFAAVCAVAGPLILGVFVNGLTAGLAVGCELIYVLLYTPLKTRTPLNTLVGAVCGALPPMMGWSAAAGGLGFGAWILGAILFLWQIPHFLALAWLYREDYARGGFRMLAVVDGSGRLTFRLILLYSLLLVPLGLTVTLAGITGPLFAAGSLLLGTGMIVVGVRLWRRRTNGDARNVFLASVVYLPLLFGLMVVDAVPGDDTTAARDRPRAAALRDGGPGIVRANGVGSAARETVAARETPRDRASSLAVANAFSADLSADTP